jgi:Uma2 family endonuclease
MPKWRPDKILGTETRMATSVHIPIGEYMQTTYRPDREYLDGELLERNVGKWEHARIQGLIMAWFSLHETAWNVMAVTEIRVQVAATRVRIPDLAIVTPGLQPEVLIEPPILVVEILSADDSFAEMAIRCADYRTMGVRTIWIVDPANRVGHIFLEREWIEGRQILQVPGTEITLDLHRIFENLYQSTTL